MKESLCQQCTEKHPKPMECRVRPNLYLKIMGKFFHDETKQNENFF